MCCSRGAHFLACVLVTGGRVRVSPPLTQLPVAPPPAQALPAWPNVLSTGHTAATVPPSSNSQPLQEGGGGSSSALARSGPALPPPPARPTSRLRSLLRRRPAGPAALLDEPLDHCWLGYKPLSRPDSRLLAQLAQPEQSGEAAAPRAPRMPGPTANRRWRPCVSLTPPGLGTQPRAGS
jgi:hypothetical protein